MTEQLANAMITCAIPEQILSDNRSELLAKELKTWLFGVDAKTPYIRLDSPWENGFFESFNGTLIDNLLDGEIFHSLQEVKVVVGQWVKQKTEGNPLRDSHMRL